MRVVFLVLALLLSLGIAIVAVINNEVVMVDYLLGQVNLTLFALILGSAAAGAVVIIFLGIFNSIRKYMKAQGDRAHTKDLQHRIKVLEDEKSNLEADLSLAKKELEDTAAKERAKLEEEMKRLQEELEQQQKEREAAIAHNQAELAEEKRRLVEELIRQQAELDDRSSNESDL